MPFRLFFFLSVFFLWSDATFAQSPHPMQFQKEIHDFGEIKSGDIVTTSFDFKNTGNAPIVITKVLTTCGCTAPNYPESAIEPGKTGKIDISFNSKNKAGIQRKTITVMNSTGTPVKLKILANVLP